MKRNERKILLIAISLPLYVLLIWHVIKPFLAQFMLGDADERGLCSAVYFDNTNATYHYLLGRFYQYSPEGLNVQRAIRLYKESLRLCPLQSGCWLDLAKACRTAGLLSDAGDSVRRAVRLDFRNPSVRWEAGVFSLISGDVADSMKNFKEYILLKPEGQEAAYDLLWKTSIDSEYVQENLIPVSYPYYKRYLLFLISSHRADEAKELWKVMTRFEVEEGVIVRYLDFLIARHSYDEAENAWRTYVGRRFKEKRNEYSLLWNGSFEHDVLNGAFDWRVADTKGVYVFIDTDVHMSGKQSLGVTFDGTQNPDITIAAQVVRVTPTAKYFLKGYIKTDSLTTKNGLFFSVGGYDCGGLYKRSDTITGTNFWEEVSVEFETPGACHAITVNIRRQKSDKLDSKIGGTAWIDGLTLEQR